MALMFQSVREGPDRELGVEPRLAVPETAVLPLDDSRVVVGAVGLGYSSDVALLSRRRTDELVGLRSKPFRSGSPGNRTPNRLLKRQLLCRLS